jgi:hypothetical protein
VYKSELVAIVTQTSTPHTTGYMHKHGQVYRVKIFLPYMQAILDHNEGAVSLIDGRGRTALHYACAEGSADCVRTLLSYKTLVPTPVHAVEPDCLKGGSIN